MNQSMNLVLENHFVYLKEIRKKCAWNWRIYIIKNAFKTPTLSISSRKHPTKMLFLFRFCAFSLFENSFFCVHFITLKLLKTQTEQTTAHLVSETKEVSNQCQNKRPVFSARFHSEYIKIFQKNPFDTQKREKHFS